MNLSIERKPEDAANHYRIALANVRMPGSMDDAVALAQSAIAEAGAARARVICFPECFLPGYRGLGNSVAPPDADGLARAQAKIARVAAQADICVILGTERIVDDQLRISALVIDRDGSLAGYQDKVQLDPSEESTYTAGRGRCIFTTDGLKFGIAICHEGWRYPETVRRAAARGAQVVFHPHFHHAEPGAYRPTRFADPANTFHEKALLCRAAENTCFIASVNFASAGSPTTSVVVRPDGTLQCCQPYGHEGLLVADIDLDAATCLLASRLVTDD